jgi:hypothetical protein
MRNFNGFKSFLEFVDDGSQLKLNKSIVTFDFDETLTRWSNGGDGLWRQVPNEANIKQYLLPHYKRGDAPYIVTFRDPALAHDPRFKIYEDIHQYINEWGMEDAIKGVIYTRLKAKGDYIFHLCTSKKAPLLAHYDDDTTNCNEINVNPKLQEVARPIYEELAVHLPYNGPRPPKDKAGVIVPGQVTKA